MLLIVLNIIKCWRKKQCMCCLRHTDIQHSKKCFARDTPSVFIVEFPKFHNALGRTLSVSSFIIWITITFKITSLRTLGFFSINY